MITTWITMSRTSLGLSRANQSKAGSPEMKPVIDRGVHATSKRTMTDQIGMMATAKYIGTIKKKWLGSTTSTV